MLTAMAKRQITRIAITDDADKVVDALCARYGMTKTELLSRVYLWFADQGETVQAGVLDLLPEDMEADIIRLFLEQRIGSPKGRKPLGIAAKHADKPSPRKSDRRSE